MQKTLHCGLLSVVLSGALLVSGCQAATTKAESDALKIEPQPPSLTTRALAESFYEVLVAEIAGQAGDLGASYALLMRAAETRRQEDLYQRAMQAALQMGDGDRALAAAHAWHDALPQSREANKAVLQVLLAFNQVPQTQWHLRRELHLSPPDEMAENLYAVPLIYQRVPDKQLVLNVAEAAMDAQLKVGSPWRGDALAALGRIHLQAGDRERALGYLREAFAANPDASGAAFLALELYAQGEVQAGAPLHRYVHSDAAAPQLLLAYARLLIAQQHGEQALEVLTRVTDGDHDLPEAWLAKAALEAGQEDYARARASLDAFEHALADAPPSLVRQRGLDEANILRAQMADLEGEHAVAERYLASVREPEAAARAQFQRAQILSRVGMVDEARRAIQSAPAFDEDTQRLKAHAEVQLLRNHGRYAEAYVLLKPLVEQDPRDDDLLYELALLAERLGNTAEMEERLRALIARSPDHFHALNALGYSLADRGVRLGEARRLITRALEMAPGNPYITDSLGWLEYREGNLTRARALLQQAYDADPDAEIGAHLGEVLWKLDQQDAARAIWREGLQDSPDNASLQETIQRLDGAHSPLLQDVQKAPGAARNQGAR